MKFEWETIESTKANKNITLRAKVIGGWMIKHRILISLTTNNKKNKKPIQTCSVGLCFIPDSNHEWVVGEKETEK